MNRNETLKVKKKQPRETLTPEQIKARKAARKAAKKELKLKKKLAKENRYKLYDPAKMKSFTLSLALGYFFRFFAIAFSLFGVCILVCDAFQLPGVNWALLLLYSVYMVSAFSLIFIGKWLALAGFAMIAAYVGLFYAAVGNILTFYLTGTELMINRVMTRLSEAGFASLSGIAFPYFGGVSDSALAYGGIFALATVLALIFSAFSAKRTRLLPMIVFGGGLCAVCFTYNLTNTNWGIACVLAGLCSAIVLAAYDKTYRKHKKSRKSRAYSGYSAALAGLLAMIMVLIPAAAAKQPFRDIPFISEPMENARMIVTTILTGGNPKYNKMNNLVKSMSAGIEDVEFEDVLLFTVNSNSSKRNVYLRSWVGDSYNFSRDAWSALDDDAYKAMLKKLTAEYGGFTGDDVASMIYEMFDPALTAHDDKDSESGDPSRAYQNHNAGAVSARVDIEYIGNTGLLFLTPSAFDRLAGLYEFGEESAKYSDSFSLYSDGVFRSSWFNLKKKYGAYAIMPSYIEETYPESAENLISFYKLLSVFLNGPIDNYGRAEAVEAFKGLLEENGVKGSADFVSSYFDLTTSERTQIKKRYVNLIRQYTDYVKQYYTAVDPTEGLRSAYEEIKPAFDAAETTHEKLMTVIDYLVDRCSYSATPKKPEGSYESDVDAFLLETKEGYCVQFATAATLLFRMFDIPARYVQGYIASGFRNAEEGELLPFTSGVTDRNAHAWVEVYIEGLGWRTYEPTPVYYTNLYHYNPDLSGAIDPYDPDRPLPAPPTDDPTLPEEEEIPEEPETDPGEEDETPTVSAFNYKLLIKILVILLIAAALAALMIWQIKRARRIVDGRAHYIERAIYGSFEDESDKNRIAGVICDSIYEVHYIIGDRPELGEGPLQFAYRVDHPPKAQSKAELKKQQRAAFRPSTFTAVTGLLEKQEFGKALTREDLTALGEYLDALVKAEYRALPVHKKIWYRYVRFMI